MKISCTKLQLPPEPLTRGLPPPDPRSRCPLSSTEFVEHPPKKIPGYATGQGTWSVLTMIGLLRKYSTPNQMEQEVLEDRNCDGRIVLIKI